MNKRIFQSWKEITHLGYFEQLKDGRLKLLVDNLSGIIDFHTHFGLTFFLAPPVDLTLKTKEVKHNFTLDTKLNLDIYSGQNLFEERPKWIIKDYFYCTFAPFRSGKHLTHTLPNILWEMDALNIEKSVCLCIDLARFSNNSMRVSEILKSEPRIIFYCCVHPKDKHSEKKIELYLKAGARGMKIHPEIQMVSVNSKPMLEHLQLWQKMSSGLPVLFHSGFNGYEPKRLLKNAAIELYYPAAEILQESPCILGHAAMNEFRKAIEIAEKYPNVYLEISGQPPDHIKEMLDRIGDDKLLFGSDWPLYPQAIPLAKVLIATEDVPTSRIKILRDNALKILR